MIVAPSLALCGAAAGAAFSSADIAAADNALQRMANVVAMARAESICGVSPKQRGVSMQDSTIIPGGERPEITATIRVAISGEADSAGAKPGAVSVTVQLQQPYQTRLDSLLGRAMIHLSARATAHSEEGTPSCAVSLTKADHAPADPDDAGRYLSPLEIRIAA